MVFNVYSKRKRKVQVMNEREVEKWGVIREKGFLRYIILRSLLWGLLGIIFEIMLSIFSKIYVFDFKDFRNVLEFMCIGAIIHLINWIVNQIKYSQYHKVNDYPK